MLNILKKIIIISLFFCFTENVYAQQKLTASVNATTVPMNDGALILTFTPVPADIPDSVVNELEKDFDIVSHQTFSSYQIINNVSYDNSRLIFGLTPKRTGKITIPSFSINGEKTSPIEITVTEHTQRNNPPVRKLSHIQSIFDNDPFFNSTMIDNTMKLFQQMSGNIPTNITGTNIPSTYPQQASSNPAQTAVNPKNKKKWQHQTDFSSDITDQDIFVKSFIDNKNPYKDEQVIYTTRVYSANPIMEEAHINPPEKIDGQYDAEQTSNIRQGTEIVNNKQYFTYETESVIFPSKSGKLEIPPATFDILIPKIGTIGYMRFLSNIGTPHIFKSDPVKIDVKNPKDNNSKSTWLPAKELTISDTMQPNETAYKVGDNITRTITISAKGQLSRNIPSINITGSDKYNVYQSLEKRDDNYDNINDYGVLGTYTKEIVIIPLESGEINLPEYKFTYFNTEKDRFETATVPAVKLSIKENITRNDKIAAEINKNEPANEQENIKQDKENIITLSDIMGKSKKFLATEQYKILISFIGGILLVFLIKIVNRKKHNSDKEAPDDIKISENDYKRDLKNAIAANDPSKAKFAAIRIYNKEFGTQYTTIEAVSANLQYIQFSAEVDILNSTLYSVEKKTWGRKEFYDTLMAGIKNKKDIIGKQPTVPKLYPF